MNFTILLTTLPAQSLLIPFTSCLQKFVVNCLQPLTQVKNRIVLAREERVHTQTSFRRQFLEAVTHQLMSDKYLALLLRQFIESSLQFFEQHAPRVKCLRPRIGRGKQFFQLENFPVLCNRSRLASQCLASFLAE